MPTTLTDEQVAELRQRLTKANTDSEIAAAAAGLWNDPEHGDAAKALWKKKYPDSKIDGYDTEQRVRAMLDERDKKAADERKAASDREQDDRLASQRKSTQEAYGFTDDAMTRLEQLMVDKGVGDYEVAAEYFASRNPRVSDGQDAGFDSQFWNHERQDTFKEIATDPEGWGRREILKTLREGERRQPGRSW
jgi:hypothetical protein